MKQNSEYQKTEIKTNKNERQRKKIYKKLERLRNRNTEIKLCRKNDKMENENNLNTKEIREN